MANGTIQDQIDAIIENAINETPLVGASVGVMRHNEVILARGYGYADLNKKVETTEHTVYRIGSTTKQFTALAIMILVEQGKVNLNDIMLDYLPHYPQGDHKVTIDQLLNHTSGIKSYTDIEKFWEISDRDLSRKEIVDLFSSEPVEFSPGENFQYNNSGYYLLGLIIENVSGMSYTDFLKANVWQPLKMFDTHYLGKIEHVKNLATGYDHKDNEFVLARPLGMDNPFSGGSLGSSILDLLKWQTAINENLIISRQSYNKMIVPGLLTDGKHTTYGYGFFLSNLNGHRKIDHGGTINGFRAQLSTYPDDGLTVTVLCNHSSAPQAQLESQISRLILGIPETQVQEIHLPEDELQLYTGTYKWRSTMAPDPFPVLFSDSKLRIVTRSLSAIGNHTFVFSTDPYYTVTFTVKDGKSVRFRAEREGQITDALRVEDTRSQQ